MKIAKLWGERLEKGMESPVEEFISGRDIQGVLAADECLISYDLWGSRAHVLMLAKEKIISKKEAGSLARGLKELELFWQKGKFHLDPHKEDVHTNVESYLINKYGLKIGGKLHTARSRNDQIILDMRLYLRDCALNFISALALLLRVLIDNAQKHRDLVLPGYTHHQPAQVTTLGHLWLSFVGAFLRDLQRFQEWHEKFNQNPLGSMTGYGTSFPIDRKLTSRLLGFDSPSPNSLDPVQSRWEPEAEMGFAITSMLNHLSSLAQTLILFSTEEFGMLKIDDAFCSGSSMMPQKRNPDPLEAIKAKAAVAQGLLGSLLSIGRSLFIGYNRDTQWSKYLIMDMVGESLPALMIMKGIVVSIRVNEKMMADLCQKGFIAAPDMLEWLVQEIGFPFRQVKMAVEKAVKYSESQGEKKISASALHRGLREEGIHLKINNKTIELSQDPKVIVSRRKAIGGTSPDALQKNISFATEKNKLNIQWLSHKRRQQTSAKRLLCRMEKNIL